MVLGIAFDPFMQNLIRYYPKLVADGSETAFVARGDRYNAFGLASHHCMVLSYYKMIGILLTRMRSSDLR